MERYLASSYCAVFLWGLAVLLGLIGLGRLLARVVGGEDAERAGWGLHAVWGTATYLFFGGCLAFFGACNELGIVVLIGSGLAAMIWTTVRGGWPTRASLAALPWTSWPAFAAVALTFSGGMAWQQGVNPADDLPAYYNFCEKLLATGSFDEPFSWRRLASLGGHTLLQCSILAKASFANAQAFEIGLCPVILLGLILGFRGGTLARSPLGVFLGLIAITTPILRVNTASHLTGTVLFLGLFATLDLVDRTGVSRRRLFAIAGLVAAGLCSLRAQNIPAAGGALGLFWLVAWIRDRRVPRTALLEAGCWVASLFAGLLPWMLMCYRSNGSPLYPFFSGNSNVQFNPQGLDAPLFNRINLPMQMIVEPTLLPLLLCLLAAPDWRRGLAARAVAISAVITALKVAYSLNLAPDEITIPRYVQPVLLASALAVLMTAASVPRTRLTAWVLSAILLGTNLPVRGQTLLAHYTALGHKDISIMPFRLAVIADYRKAQLLVPEGRRIFVCTDFPFLFDHKRNPIWTVDLPNGACPPPGLPFQKPPDETIRYLRQLGVEHLIFGSFDTTGELYSREKWEKHSLGNVPLFKIQALFFLDCFNTIERIAASEITLGQVGKLNVIQFRP